MKKMANKRVSKRNKYIFSSEDWRKSELLKVEEARGSLWSQASRGGATHTGNLGIRRQKSSFEGAGPVA